MPFADVQCGDPSPAVIYSQYDFLGVEILFDIYFVKHQAALFQEAL